jgi:hypothetical protein
MTGTHLPVDHDLCRLPAESVSPRSRTLVVLAGRCYFPLHPADLAPRIRRRGGASKGAAPDFTATPPCSPCFRKMWERLRREPKPLPSRDYGPSFAKYASLWPGTGPAWTKKGEKSLPMLASPS